MSGHDGALRATQPPLGTHAQERSTRRVRTMAELARYAQPSLIPVAASVWLWNLWLVIN